MRRVGRIVIVVFIVFIRGFMGFGFFLRFGLDGRKLFTEENEDFNLGLDPVSFVTFASFCLGLLSARQ
jgi:hypothetical protein